MNLSPDLEQYRCRSGPYTSRTHDPFGKFEVPHKTAKLTIVAHDGVLVPGDPLAHLAGWEHVSVSTANRCPNWPEMCFVKDLFWSEEEAVVQYHPKKSAYVNYHPYCLHLWRPVDIVLPLPPYILVGPKGMNNEK